jgi:hypothetical protein
MTTKTRYFMCKKHEERAGEMLFRSLCKKHLVEIAPIPEEILLETLMDGTRARKTFASRRLRIPVM